MGLESEWRQTKDKLARLAEDIFVLGIVTSVDNGTGVARTARSALQIDGDTQTTVSSDVGGLVSCHRSALAFGTGLANARARMLIKVIRSFV